MLAKLKSFITECKRVLRITKKPDNQEFMNIVKVSSLGIIIIGVLGYLIGFAIQLLRTMVQ